MYYKKMLLNQLRFLMLIVVLVVVRVTLTYNFTICLSSFTKKKKKNYLKKGQIGEGNGNPLQYSCLEKSMDRGAWWAAVHGVT